MVRLLELEVLGGPHLVLADLGGDEDVLLHRARQRIQPLDRVLRLDDRPGLHVLGELQAVLRPPDIDLPPPRRQRLAVHRRRVGVPRRQQRRQRASRVGDDRHLHRNVLVDRGRIDVDVDLLRALAERVQPSGHPVVESRPDRQQHVAAVHRQVRLVGAVHPQHPEEPRVAGGERTQAHQRVGDREPGGVNELRQQHRGLGPGVDHPAAGIDHRPPGRFQQRDRLGDLRRIGLGLRVVAAMHRRRFGIRRLGDHDVLRQVDHHRTRPPGACHVERLVHHARQIGGTLHQVVVLGRRPGDPRGVRLLEGVVADQVGRHLAGQADDRNAVHQRVDQPGHRVRRPRPRGHQHHADLAGGARIALGRVHRAPLLADQDVADRVLLEQRVVDRQDGAARVAENHLHALVLQGAQQDLGPRLGGCLAGDCLAGVCRHGHVPYGRDGRAPGVAPLMVEPIVVRMVASGHPNGAPRGDHRRRGAHG